MKIYTKTGDSGETGLYGGTRIAKNALRVTAYGTVDECNAMIGLARAHLAGQEDLDAILQSIQNRMFDVGADLATPFDSQYRSKVAVIDEDDVVELEQIIDRLEGELEPLKNFIHPGGHIGAASLHVARTTARRAEREVVSLSEAEEINPATLRYLNRLSDLLFVLARYANKVMGGTEHIWEAKTTT